MDELVGFDLPPQQPCHGVGVGGQEVLSHDQNGDRPEVGPQPDTAGLHHLDVVGGRLHRTGYLVGTEFLHDGRFRLGGLDEHVTAALFVGL